MKNAIPDTRFFNQQESIMKPPTPLACHVFCHPLLYALSSVEKAVIGYKWQLTGLGRK